METDTVRQNGDVGGPKTIQDVENVRTLLVS